MYVYWYCSKEEYNDQLPEGESCLHVAQIRVQHVSKIRLQVIDHILLLNNSFGIEEHKQGEGGESLLTCCILIRPQKMSVIF
jgi:hypothetical protein